MIPAFPLLFVTSTLVPLVAVLVWVNLFLGALPSQLDLHVEQCSDLVSVSLFPLLTTLKLHECPNLSAISSLPSLTTFELEQCPNLIAVRAFPHWLARYLATHPSFIIASLRLRSIRTGKPKPAVDGRLLVAWLFIIYVRSYMTTYLLVAWFFLQIK
jgi:hypothetical protein